MTIRASETGNGSDSAHADAEARLHELSTRVIHSSEIADDPGGFHGAYVPVEDYQQEIAILQKEKAAAEAEVAALKSENARLSEILHIDVPLTEAKADALSWQRQCEDARNFALSKSAEVAALKAQIRKLVAKWGVAANEAEVRKQEAAMLALRSCAMELLSALVSKKADV